MQGRISGSLQKFFMMQIRFPVRVIRVRLRRTVTGAEKEESENHLVENEETK